VLYAAFDNILRYLALYHPTGSTDALVVVALPLWWVVCLVVTAGTVAVTLAARRRHHGKGAVTS
jgi:hypothetical protein